MSCAQRCESRVEARQKAGAAPVSQVDGQGLTECCVRYSVCVEMPAPRRSFLSKYKEKDSDFRLTPREEVYLAGGRRALVTALTYI